MKQKWIEALVWSTCIMQYHSAIKGTDVLKQATTWMYWENIMLSKRNQMQGPHIL